MGFLVAVRVWKKHQMPSSEHVNVNDEMTVVNLRNGYERCFLPFELIFRVFKGVSQKFACESGFFILGDVLELLSACRSVLLAYARQTIAYYMLTLQETVKSQSPVCKL